MVEESGRVRWHAGSGLKIVEIRHPDIDAPRAILVSTLKGPTRQMPRDAEEEAAFVRRVTALAKGRGDCEEITLFLPVLRRLVARVRLDD